MDDRPSLAADEAVNHRGIAGRSRNWPRGRTMGIWGLKQDSRNAATLVLERVSKAMNLEKAVFIPSSRFDSLQ